MSEKKGNIAIFVPHAGCKNACVFCNQRSISGACCQPEEGDIRAACRRAAETPGLNRRTAELSFFGGSFTAIERERMLWYLKLGRELVQSYGFRGIRISTRPDAIDPEIIAVLREYGVTAVELGAQSMDDAVLRACARGHTAQDVRDAAALVKAAGFELTLQMMTGLPGDDNAGALRTARALAALRPDGVRIYPCLVLEDTPLAALFREGKYRPQSLDEAVELSAQLLAFFAQEKIPVRKLGLHASDEYAAGALLAGPYHPAFRELAESRMLFEAVCEALRGCETAGRRILLAIHPRDRSALTGQRKGNLARIMERFAPEEIQIEEREELPRGSVRVQVV